MSKETYHHGDLRNSLIAAGLGILREDGVSALSLRKVARRAGVSHAAPYRHFADKGALLAAIAEEGFHELARLIRPNLTNYAAQPARLLEETGWSYVRFGLRNPDHLQVMFSPALVDFTAYPMLLEASMAALGLLVEAIRIAQGAGAIAAGDPFQLALATWSMVHGITVLLVGEKLPIADCLSLETAEPVARMQLSVFFDGLRHGLPAAHTVEIAPDAIYGKLDANGSPIPPHE